MIPLEQKNKLYVGNLPWAIGDNELKDLFSKFGDIEEAVVIKNKFNNRSKGFGFVTFKEDTAADSAAKEMHQFEVMERKLVVNFAKPKKEDQPTNFTPTNA